MYVARMHANAAATSAFIRAIDCSVGCPRSYVRAGFVVDWRYEAKMRLGLSIEEDHAEGFSRPHRKSRKNPERI